MTEVLFYWRDFRKNTAAGSAHRWHSNAWVLSNLAPRDRLWLVTSGKALNHGAEHTGFLIVVWKVEEVTPNPNDDPPSVP